VTKYDERIMVMAEAPGEYPASGRWFVGSSLTKKMTMVWGATIEDRGRGKRCGGEIQVKFI
jgi:hypothetical protein